MEQEAHMDKVYSAEDISMAAGVLLSLSFSYVPNLKGKFSVLTPTRKRLVMLALLVLVTGGVFGLICLGVESGSSCDQHSAWGLLRALILAIIANQSAYSLSPRPEARVRRYEGQ
jgi:hypothetical protein